MEKNTHATRISTFNIVKGISLMAKSHVQPYRCHQLSCGIVRIKLKKEKKKKATLDLTVKNGYSRLGVINPNFLYSLTFVLGFVGIGIVDQRLSPNRIKRSDGKDIPINDRMGPTSA